MQPDDRDQSYLWDMHTAASEIHEFMSSCFTLDSFSNNKLLRYAVERQLLVLGEAAKQVSESYKLKHPEIPWALIIGQRNVLAHDYGEILVERIWLAATKSLPELLEWLKKLLDE